MKKTNIKNQVYAAYREAKEYPNFMEHFKPKIQQVIDSLLPSDATAFWHVNKDIDYLAEICKSMNYSSREFLRLVTNYISLLVEAHEKRLQAIDVKKLFQTDIFEDED